MNISYRQVENQTQAVSTCELMTNSEALRWMNSVFVEEFKISSEGLIDAIKEMIYQNNIRRIIVQNEEGNSLLQIPMMVSVADSLVGIDLSRELVSLDIIAATVTQPHIVVERAA